MFGIMGIGSAFVNAAGRGGKKKEFVGVRLKSTSADPTIAKISCTGTIVVKSIKNGEPLKQNYTDLSDSLLSIQSDSNEYIEIVGKVNGELCLGTEDDGHNFKEFLANNTELTKINISHNYTMREPVITNNANLLTVDTGDTSITKLSLSSNPAVRTLTMLDSLDMEMLDAFGCTHLAHFSADIGIRNISIYVGTSDVTEALMSITAEIQNGVLTVQNGIESIYDQSLTAACGLNNWTYQKA